MVMRSLSMPEIGMIAGTRVALGAGLGLLIANKFSADVRKGIGVTLLAVGLLTTIPLAADVLSKPPLDRIA